MLPAPHAVSSYVALACKGFQLDSWTIAKDLRRSVYIHSLSVYIYVYMYIVLN